MTDHPSSVVPLALRELVQRLSTALSTPFTLTDEQGAVAASSADLPPGHTDSTALRVLREGEGVEKAGKLPPAERDESKQSDPNKRGSTTQRPGVYLPVWISGRIDGVLIAHGQPDEVRAIAGIAAAAVGVAIEFARNASTSARLILGSDLALHRILRGSPTQARRAAIVAKVIGWDLSVPRVALVILALRSEGAARVLGADKYAMIQKFIETVAPGTPFAQFEAHEWVLLPEVSAGTGRPPANQLTEGVNAALVQAGVTASLGLSEPHIEPSLPALRQSYREAVYAARLGRRLHSDGRVHTLRDLGPAAFLAPSSASRRRLAERVVQPLRTQPEVLRTVQAFLTADRSFATTAQLTSLHRHTIRNHLDRAHNLTGLDPRSFDDALQLRLALLVLTEGV